MTSFLAIFWSTLRWQDVVDIGLNAYILFRFYVLFRGTNTFRVVIGIALLWFIQRLAVSMGLIVTSWALQGLTAVAALIIIVVFRYEIRSVFQTKNLKGILWGFPPRAVKTPVEIISEGVFEMAERRTGALIVLPGKEGPNDLTQSGTPWGGLLSKEMLHSIFWPDNPVHDGAAIIEGESITRVGVILPLSTRRDLPSHYGTRHRAAVGLAETTEALMILVSEESGKVLVVKGSQINHLRTPPQLRRVLQKHLGLWGRKRDARRKEKVQLGIAAALSLMVITGIWFSFSRGLETLMTLDVPIQYMNREADVEILEASLNSVNLHLSGSGALIQSVRPDQVQVKVDLSQAVVGQNSFNIMPENVALPPGVALKKIEPAVVEVTLDKPVQKQLPIQADWTGKLDPGLIIESISLEPDRVEIVGGKDLLDKMTTLYTEKIALDRIKESGQLTVSLTLQPASIKLASGSKGEVIVQFKVAARVP